MFHFFLGVSHLFDFSFYQYPNEYLLHFTAELPDEVKSLEILNSMNGFGSSDPKLPATLTNQVFQVQDSIK